MQKEIVVAAKTVEEALQRAYDALGVDSSETGFEILQMPRRGFLGFKTSPAKVRVYVLEEEKEEPPSPAAAAPAEKPPVPARKPAQPQKTAAQPLKIQHKPEAVQEPEAIQKKPQSEKTQEARVSEKGEAAKAYVSGILRAMGVEKATVRLEESKESLEIFLEGDGLGVIIGRRGETLDAVQYLTSLVVNRLEGDYVRVSIDSGDYRKKRAETLERLAVKLARNAVKTGRPTKLEPMNPYERRIIHAAVSKVEGAASSSIGEEPNRRVVIASKNPKRRSEGSRDYQPREDRPRDNRIDRTRRVPRKAPLADPSQRIQDKEIEIPKDLAPKDIPAPKPVPPKKETAVSAPTEIEKEAMPLYGKLDL